MTLDELKVKVTCIKKTLKDWVDEGVLVPEEAQAIAIMLIEEIIKKESLKVPA